ncbi:Prefoldin subunit 4 [Lactarius akahatsu]|uniref:Prefoldin subunit 4 n=1 Tax=Lactarius akahatsu TaxID=416441 RepID=A0AAD4LM97_9AGAM|nr:Prefoldin subunit 4 [Lactarius akahatsu]
MRMLSQEEEADDGKEVTWEDQQRINTFSKLNTRVRSLAEKMNNLKQEKEAFDDLAMELELADEDQPVLYKVGEAFLHLPHHRAMKRLERDQAHVDEEIAKLTGVVDQCEQDMKALKVELYGRFGSAINLDE